MAQAAFRFPCGGNSHTYKDLSAFVKTCEGMEAMHSETLARAKTKLGSPRGRWWRGQGRTSVDSRAKTLRPVSSGRILAVLGMPAVFLVLGLALRYLAYASVDPQATLARFPDALCLWDCRWYVGLAENGYDPFPSPGMVNAGNWAFFPLFPVLVGLLRLAIPAPTILVATGASLVLAYGAVLAAWPLLRDLRAYLLYAAFVLCGPFSIYFSTFYTEVLFVLLATAGFVALQQRNYLLAALCGALLSATRIVGVFFVLAILAQAFLDHRARGGRVLDFVPAVLRRADLVLAIFLAPLGLFLYMAFLHWHIGDALAFSHVQRAWAREVGNPLLYLWRGLTRFPAEGFVPTVSQQLALAAVTGLALTAILFWRRRVPAALFSLVCILVPLAAGLASMVRFMVAQPPLVLQLVELLGRSRIAIVLALAGFLVADYYFTIAWLGGYLTLV